MALNKCLIAESLGRRSAHLDLALVRPLALSRQGLVKVETVPAFLPLT